MFKMEGRRCPTDAGTCPKEASVEPTETVIQQWGSSFVPSGVAAGDIIGHTPTTLYLVLELIQLRHPESSILQYGDYSVKSDDLKIPCLPLAPSKPSTRITRTRKIQSGGNNQTATTENDGSAHQNSLATRDSRLHRRQCATVEHIRRAGRDEGRHLRQDTGREGDGHQRGHALPGPVAAAQHHLRRADEAQEHRHHHRKQGSADGEPDAQGPAQAGGEGSAQDLPGTCLLSPCPEIAFRADHFMDWANGALRGACVNAAAGVLESKQIMRRRTYRPAVLDVEIPRLTLHVHRTSAPTTTSVSSPPSATKS